MRIFSPVEKTGQLIHKSNKTTYKNSARTLFEDIFTLVCGWKTNKKWEAWIQNEIKNTIQAKMDLTANEM